MASLWIALSLEGVSQACREVQCGGSLTQPYIPSWYITTLNIERLEYHNAVRLTLKWWHFLAGEYDFGSEWIGVKDFPAMSPS